MGKLEGYSVIITGGGTGIGRACALRMARDGARITVGDIRDDNAAETVRLVESEGGQAIAVHCDVTSEDQVDHLAARAVEAFGGVNGLVASAGTSVRAPVHELSLDDWDRILRINLTGSFLACRAAVRRMLDGDGGSIVTIGSVQSVVIAGRGSAAYKASKAGILMLTRTIAAEYGHRGIRANCVCPGGVETPLLDHVAEDTERYATSQPREESRTYPVPTPIQRNADPMEIANVCAFLLSEEASFMTGAAVMVDGGYTAI